MKNFLVPKWIKKYIELYREKGFKVFLKEAGWKVFAFIFIFYLIRDAILYILIPYLVAKGLLS